MLYVRSKQEKIKERQTSMPATGRAALYGRRGDVEILLNRRKVRNVDKSDKWHGDIRSRSLREARNGERTSLSKRRKYATDPNSIYTHPKSFLNLLISPGLRMVGEGSALHIQQGAMTTPGFDVGRSNMGDPRVFSRKGLVSGEQSGLTVCGMAPIC